MSEEKEKEIKLDIETVLAFAKEASLPVLDNISATLSLREKLLTHEYLRLSRKDQTAKTTKQLELTATRRYFPLFSDQMMLKKELLRMDLQSHSDKQVIIHGRVVDDRLLGLQKFKEKEIKVAIFHQKKLYGAIDSAEIDENGYYFFIINSEHLEKLKELKPNTLVIRVVDSSQKPVAEFESPEISITGDITGGTSIVANIQFSSTIRSNLVKTRFSEYETSEKSTLKGIFERSEITKPADKKKPTDEKKPADKKKTSDEKKPPDAITKETKEAKHEEEKIKAIDATSADSQVEVVDIASSKVEELRAIKKIGKAKAERLVEKGFDIHNIESATDDELREILSEKEVEELKENLREYLKKGKEEE
ncbi:MAG: helix-hairpin-helix domain-containing protein [Candidatus Thorarchaeota archaeon]